MTRPVFLAYLEQCLGQLLRQELLSIMLSAQKDWCLVARSGYRSAGWRPLRGRWDAELFQGKRPVGVLTRFARRPAVLRGCSLPPAEVTK